MALALVGPSMACSGRVGAANHTEGGSGDDGAVVASGDAQGLDVDAPDAQAADASAPDGQPLDAPASDATMTGDTPDSSGVEADNDPGLSTTGDCTLATLCDDFPVTPFIDPGVPSNPGELFGVPLAGTSAGAPCLVEPADGALYPKNWQRLRVLWIPASSAQTLFEVRLHTDVETNDYVAYTANTSFTIDAATWQAIALDGRLQAQPIQVTVRGLTPGQPPAVSSASFTIAGAAAKGTLVYWTTASFDEVGTNTTLQEFNVGDEDSKTALQASQVQEPVRAQPLDGGNLEPALFNRVFCIGCHTATPDGNYVSFVSQFPWAVALASVQSGTEGSSPPWLTAGAASNLSPDINGYFAPPTLSQVMMGLQTFSPAHYTTGDRRLVAGIGATWNQTEAQFEAGVSGSPTGVVSELAWFDLETTAALPAGGPFDPWGSGDLTSPLPLAANCTSSGLGVSCATAQQPVTAGWGIITRTGDTNSAGAPSWSHDVDGKTDLIAYASTNLGIKDGRMDCEGSGPSCTSDIYTVPYADGLGGAASPLPGASDPAHSEYYPAWSPDDQLVAFNRVPTGMSMYAQPLAEVFVVPFNGGQGGAPVRLAANDPPACTGLTSPGVQNTWPKWAQNPPETDANGNTYYWLTFSSSRSPTAATDAGGIITRKEQLYVAGVVRKPDGEIVTYAPIYLWNQDPTVNNLIPAWGPVASPGGSPLPSPPGP